MVPESFKRLAGIAACLAVSVQATAQILPGTVNSPAPPGAGPIPVKPFAHGVTLAALGQRDGIAFSGLTGRQELYFVVPDGSGDLRLTLPYEASVAAPVARTVTVLSRNRVLGRVPIAETGVIDLPVPDDAVVAGALPISLVYGGAASANLCFDRRAAQDRLLLLPSGGLAMALTPGSALSVATAAALAGVAPPVALPANPTPVQAAAALSVIAARGGTLTTGVPATDHVRVGGAGEPALAAAWRGNAAELAIGGRDPAAAARAAFSRYAGALSASRVDRLSVGARASDRVTLAALGADTSPRDIGDTATWSVALPASRLPAGKTIDTLAVDIAAASGTAGDRASLWFNNVLLGATPLAASGRSRLRVKLPDGAMHSLNGISVRVTRQQPPNCSDAPATTLAQLLPSSYVTLREAGPVRDFHDFAAASQAGLTVVLPGPAALPLATRLVAGLADASVPISVSWRTIPQTGPVLLVADRPPAGAKLPLTIDGGRLRLKADGGEVALDVPDGATTIAQLFDFDGRPVVWVRPSPGVVPTSMWLDQGDVAFVGANGRIDALSSTRPDLALAPPVPDDGPSFWDRNQRLILIVLGALAGIFIVAWSLRPSQRKRRDTEGL